MSDQPTVPPTHTSTDEDIKPVSTTMSNPSQTVENVQPTPTAQSTQAPVEPTPMQDIERAAENDPTLKEALAQVNIMSGETEVVEVVQPGYLFDFGEGEQNRLDGQSIHFLNVMMKYAPGVFGDNPPGYIVEGGCNKGIATREFAKLYRTHQIIGLDKNLNAINDAIKAAPKFLESDLVGNLEFHVFDLGEDVLPFADGSVGAFFLSLVCVHLLPAEIKHMLKEFKRTAAKKARMLILEPNMRQVPAIFRTAIWTHLTLHILLYEAMKKLGRTVNAPEVLEEMLTSVGFTNVQRRVDYLEVGASRGLSGRAYLNSTFAGPLTMIKAIIGVFKDWKNEDVLALLEAEIKQIKFLTPPPPMKVLLEPVKQLLEKHGGVTRSFIVEVVQEDMKKLAFPYSPTGSMPIEVISAEME